MAGSFGTPDATGRSSGKHSGRCGKLMKPPPGEPWVWHTRELITSDAWRSQSITCRRFIELLELDHMNHAGTENGHLMVQYWHEWQRVISALAHYNILRRAVILIA